jgi:predicted anti-sigma-YlaC factor YlaD
MMGKRRCRPNGKAGSPSCDLVQQAISSALDGEAPGLAAKDMDAHLARCPECQRFRAGALTLSGQLGLEVSRPVPGVLKEVLTSEWVRSVGPAPHHSQREALVRGRRTMWRRRVQWASALTPTVLLAVALPLGALSSPREIPSHASTPCTIDLAHFRGDLHH